MSTLTFEVINDAPTIEIISVGVYDIQRYKVEAELSISAAGICYWDVKMSS